MTEAQSGSARGEALLELVEHSIARIERLNPQLNAVILTAFSDARERAVREDLPAGPFRSAPTLIKDIGGHQANQTLHAGSRFLKVANYIPPGNSYVTGRLLGAGLSTNVPEFASSAASILVVTRDEVGVPNTRRFSQLVPGFFAVRRLMCSSQAQRMGATSAALLGLTFGKRVFRRLGREGARDRVSCCLAYAPRKALAARLKHGPTERVAIAWGPSGATAIGRQGTISPGSPTEWLAAERNRSAKQSGPPRSVSTAHRITVQSVRR